VGSDDRYRQRDPVVCHRGFAQLVVKPSVLTSRNSLGFLNTSRSRKIVRDVWSRNNNGELLVDWVDILIEYDWEIMFT